jgi:hypothetical protein
MRTLLAAAILLIVSCGSGHADDTSVTKSDGVGCFEKSMLGKMVARFRAGSLTKADWLARCIKIDAGTTITMKDEDKAAWDDDVPGNIILRVRVNGSPIWITPSMLLPE